VDNAGNKANVYIKAVRDSGDGIVASIDSSQLFSIGAITRGVTETFTNIGSGIRNIFTGNNGAQGSAAPGANTAVQNTVSTRTTRTNSRIDTARMAEMARFADAAGVNIEDLAGIQDGYRSTGPGSRRDSLRPADGYARLPVPASMARTPAQKPAVDSTAKQAAAQNAEQTGAKAETGIGNYTGKTPAESADTGGIQIRPEEAPVRTEDADRAGDILTGEEPETTDKGTVLISAAAFNWLSVTMPEPLGGEEPEKNGGMQEHAVIPAKIRERRKGARRKPCSTI
jgi:hypothetical protein